MEEPNTFFKDALDPKLDQIKKDLEGNSVTSKLEAMKRLIAVSFYFTLLCIRKERMLIY